MTELENDIKESQMQESRIRTYILDITDENFNNFNTLQSILTKQMIDIQDKSIF